MSKTFLVRVITVFTVFRLLTDFVCLYNYEFWLSLCKIVRSSVILLLPLLSFTPINFSQYHMCFYVLYGKIKGAEEKRRYSLIIIIPYSLACVMWLVHSWFASPIHFGNFVITLIIVHTYKLFTISHVFLRIVWPQAYHYWRWFEKDIHTSCYGFQTGAITVHYTETIRLIEGE
jgi:hypothetical protein